jgi:hypothetical protein
LSEEELLERSNLVALVRVLSVTCTGVAKDPVTKEDIPSWAARLELIEVKKGAEKPGDIVTVAWQAVPHGIVGPWTVYYYPGEEAWTHLRQAGDAFATTWWNAKGEPIQKPLLTALPQKPGQTVAMPQR